MGYGGSDRESGKALGRSGDGGVDGYNEVNQPKTILVLKKKERLMELQGMTVKIKRHI